MTQAILPKPNPTAHYFPKQNQSQTKFKPFYIPNAHHHWILLSCLAWIFKKLKSKCQEIAAPKCQYLCG